LLDFLELNKAQDGKRGILANQYCYFSDMPATPLVASNVVFEDVLPVFVTDIFNPKGLSQ
jgi:hypothetical protein